MTIHARSSTQLGQSWQTELGPYLVVDQVAKGLQISYGRMEALVRDRTLLELSDDRGTKLYPMFTFAADEGHGAGLHLVPGLKPLLDSLARSCTDEWLWALWLSGWNPRHNGRAPIDRVSRGDMRVLEKARNEDWSWTTRYF